MKRLKRWLSAVIAVSMLCACLPPLSASAADQAWEAAFYNDVDGNGETELLPLCHYGVTETEQTYLYTDENITYPFSEDDADFAAKQAAYLAVHPEIVPDHSVNPDLTVRTKQEEVLLYWLHVPYDYNPDKSYPVLIYAPGEDDTENVIYTKYLNNDGTYRSEKFNMPAEADTFMTAWYNLVKDPGDSRETYDCFFIYIVNPVEGLYSRLNSDLSQNNLAFDNQYNDYFAQTESMDARVTGDTDYTAAYEHSYDASRLTAASQEQLTVQLIDRLAGEYNIDTSRQYVMGYASGGLFAVDLISHYPGRFACAVPVCALSADISAENCRALTTTNLWAIAGDSDTVASKYITRAFAEAIGHARVQYGTGSNMESRYSILPGGHESGYLGCASAEAVAGNSITSGTEILDFVFTSRLGSDTPVCQIDGVSYGTLEAAVEAAGQQNNKAITLLADVAGTDFRGYTLTIDLNGHRLTGTVQNAQNTDILNSSSQQVNTLSAEGVYHCNVTRLVADGYGVKTSSPTVMNKGTAVEKNQVYFLTADDGYRITAEVTAACDRSTVHGGWDVFTGDSVTVTVRVTGADFGAADVTLTYDSTRFQLTDYPSDTWEASGGTLHFCQSRAANDLYADGFALGTFTFTASEIAETAQNLLFSLTTADAYVAAETSEGWNTNADNLVEADHCTNGTVTVMLRNLSAYALKATDLTYTATAQELMKSGYYAKDNTTEAAVTDAAIVYACVTAAEQAAPEFDAASLVYTDAVPTAVHAGDYTVYYRISKAGYTTVEGSVTVTIAKAKRTVTWTAADFVPGVSDGKLDNAGNPVSQMFYKVYSETAAAMPTAMYDSLETNTPQAAAVTMTSGGSTLKSVGAYTATAAVSDDYELTNPTCTLLIDGAKIQGYSLEYTNEGSTVWFDGKYHTPAKLVCDGTGVDGAAVSYSLDGAVWSSQIPSVKDAGTYRLTVKITADSYYDYTESLPFEIKSVQYLTEKSDYVAGWSLVLAYTDDDVPGFTYKGKLMYDVSSLGYAFGAVYNAAGDILTVSGTAYTHVYAMLVKGTASVTAVVPSNATAKALENSPANRYDINGSGSVDINDLVAAQGVYNCNRQYLTDDQMSIVLRADVSGNKKADIYDCALIKLNTPI